MKTVSSVFGLILLLAMSCAKRMHLPDGGCSGDCTSSPPIGCPSPNPNGSEKCAGITPQAKTGKSDAAVPQNPNSPIQPSTNLGQAAKQVAIVGDSQSAGPYGANLSDLIRNNTTAKLNFFGGACSAQIRHWVEGGFTAIPSACFRTCESDDAAPSCSPQVIPGTQTKRIASIIANHPKVDLFIITLGDNHFDSPSTVTREVPLLVNPILEAGRSCVWVTPTRGLERFANKEQLIKTLTDALAAVKAKMGRGCTLVDSYRQGADVLKTNSDLKVMNDSLLNDPMRLHPQGAGAKLWADRVLEKLLKDGVLASR
jgi:hypothetical protein